MSLRLKVLTTISVAVIAFTALDFGIQRFIIFPSYLELEAAEAEKDVNRCARALRSEIHHLDMFTNDWAAWDDTYRFISDRNPDYIESNLGHQTFIDNGLNVIWICDVEGNVIWGEWHDPDTGEILKATSPDSFPLKLTRHNSAESYLAGVYMSDRGPMLVSSRPVIPSERKGIVRGALIMGRLLTDDINKTLVTQTNVEHSILPIGQGRLTPHLQRILEQLSTSRTIHIVTGENRLSAFTQVPDLSGAPALLIQVHIPRDIIAKGMGAMRYAVASNLAAGLVLLGVLLVLSRRIIRPITDLTRHAVAIRDSGNLSLRIASGRRDEIGLLTREFARMVRQQQSSHQELEAKIAARTADLQASNQRLITEMDVRKKAQAALHSAHNRLEQEVEVRTAELVAINEQLTYEVAERRQAEIELRSYHHKLRSLSSQLLLAEEGERRRIASELHDRIGQTLTILKIRLDAIIATRATSDLGIRLDQIGLLIDQIIQDTRQLTFELSPPILYELGLEEALEWLVEQFQTEHEMAISFEDDRQAKPTTNSCRVLLFQACRELLFNIVKHAHANHVAVAIKRIQEQVEITINDDGNGFSPKRNGIDTSKNSGFGLFSIRERLRHLGGGINIRSAPGEGTRVCLSAPLDTAKEGQI